MHQAPPVEYPLGNNRTLNRVASAAWLFVTLIDLLWLYLADSHGWRLWLGLGATLLLGAVALRLRPAACSGALHWDGSGWAQHDGATEVGGDVTVHLDLQSAILVAWAPDAGRATWCWLESAADPSRWLALRRALYTPHRAGHAQGETAGRGPVMQA
ncbi:MAG: hypothetical protein ABJA49_14065 [Betaproteobacteria bacterium]